MGTGITDVIGGPHDFLPLRSDEFQKLWKVPTILGVKNPLQRVNGHAV